MVFGYAELVPLRSRFAITLGPIADIVVVGRPASLLGGRAQPSLHPFTQSEPWRVVPDAVGGRGFFFFFSIGSKRPRFRSHTIPRRLLRLAKFPPPQEYDAEIARKAQIAYDNGLAINFMDLERIEQNLPKLLKEKEQMEAVRKEILGRGVGDYTPLKSPTDQCKIETFKLKMPDSYRNLLEK